MQKVAADFTVQRSEATLEAPRAAAPVRLPNVGGRLVAGLARATDGQLALLISGLLFLIAAWPLALVDIPPFQDLPNHLAAVTVIRNPGRYPELVFNGFFKTNSALFTWLLTVGRFIGAGAAARLFALLVLALGALAYPRFVLSFAGRRRM